MKKHLLLPCIALLFSMGSLTAATWGDDSETIGMAKFVKIDVLPDSEDKTLNSADQEFKFAILGSDDFDVNSIDKDKLTINGFATSAADCSASDINNDAQLDLVCNLATTDLDLKEGDNILTFKGQTQDGDSFEGTGMLVLQASE